MVTAHEPARPPGGTTAAALRIYVLGGFRAEVAGQPIAAARWTRRSAPRVLALLAVERDHQLHRDRLLDLLWPGLAADAALNSLHKALHAARHALEPGLPAKEPSSFLRMADGLVALVAGSVWIDLDAAVALAERALRARDPARLDAAFAGLRGDPLPEDQYEDWVAEARGRVRELRLRLLLERAALLEEQGEEREAIACLQRATEQDPAREDLHRRLMATYLRTGSRHQALRQYQRCREALRRELDAAPEEETEALHREILTGPLAGGRPGAPALPAALRRVPSGPLIARQEALRFLERERRRAIAGQGGLVLVSGEAGVGKTRLLAEVARRSGGQGLCLLWGTSYAEERLLPYGAFVEALDEWALRQPEPVRADLGARFPELARLVPGFGADRAAARDRGGDGQRARLFAAVVRFLTELAERAPLLLALDDLHAADASSVQLLHHLARAAGDRRWLIVGSYRTEDLGAGGALEQLLRTAQHWGLARTVELLCLAPEETRQLAESALDGAVEEALAAHLHARSRGNPLFVCELARALHGGGVIALRDGAWRLTAGRAELVPSGVRDLVELRVARAGGAARATVELVAVAGMEVPFGLLRAAAPLPEAALVAALDWALRASILEEGGDGYAFRHPLFRAALYGRLSDARRAHLHRALLAALEQVSPDAVEALALHAVQGHEPRRALAYLEAAGDRARHAYAHEVAESYYRQVLDLGPALLAPGGEGRVREKLAGALEALARYDQALEQLGRAEARARSAGDAEAGACVIAQSGRIHFLRGSPALGLERLERGIAEAQRAGVSARGTALLLVALAHCRSAVDDFPRQLAAARRAADLAQAAGDERLRAEAQNRLGAALHFLGRRDEALPALEAAVAGAAAQDDLPTLRRALNSLAEVYEEDGDFRRCCAYRERSMAVAERAGDPAQVAMAASSLAGILAWLGEWRRARALQERAAAIFADLGPSVWAPYPHCGLHSLTWLMGEREVALGHLEQAVALARQTGNVEAEWLVQCGRAHIDLLEGRPEAALRGLHEFYEQTQRTDWIVAHLRFLEVEAYRQLGEPDRALGLADEALARARAANLRLAAMRLLRCRARVLVDLGRWPEAEAALGELLATTRAMPYPEEQARALLVLAALRRAQGAIAPAEGHLREALAIFERLGDRLDAGATRAALDALPR
jgi:DNA-binding SARP family transcriptional activator